MDGPLQDIITIFRIYFLDGLALLISAAALIYAALSFRIANQALKSAEAARVADLKLKALDGQSRAKQSLLSLQRKCQEVRTQWNTHHKKHLPKLAGGEFREADTKHISIIESEGHKLLASLEVDRNKLEKLSAFDLEDYIQKAERVDFEIRQLELRISRPEPIRV